MEGLHRRAGGSLSVCLTWPGLLFAPRFCEKKPPKGPTFFFFFFFSKHEVLPIWLQKFSFAAAVPPTSSTISELAAGRRVACREREGVVCVCKCVSLNGKNETGGGGICVFLDGTCRVSLRGKQQQACVLEENSYWPFCRILPSFYSDDDLVFVKCPSEAELASNFPLEIS